jgi:hypothetical protein
MLWLAKLQARCDAECPSMHNRSQLTNYQQASRRCHSRKWARYHSRPSSDVHKRA